MIRFPATRWWRDGTLTRRPGAIIFLSASSRARLICCLLVAALAAASLLGGCGLRRASNLERIFADASERRGKHPVIVIPGILGSQLVNRRTGEVVWPSVFRSAEDGLSLPVSPDLAANRDDLVASKIIDV
ncbi:MAG: hypothetical protein M3R15_09115, partial [Acidobacteriota bacterium]|nr:hypothetical protein [Acidobacteriota bacterium]